MAVALIVAAGRGERLGHGRPKALVPLCGRPMLHYSVEALRRVAEVDAVVVALPEEALDQAPEGTIAVAGGAHRSQSVANALSACPAGDPVIVHDAARPLAGAELFSRALAELARTPSADAVIVAAPVSDTIKEVAEDGSTVVRTLDRSRLWAVQTPQVFRRGALERALAAAGPRELAAATDDAWLVERAGGLVRVLLGDPCNLKVTTGTDLALAEIMLAGGREPGGSR
ncbi:MAG TPA: 2-C-methyl-D-erythritol 4-phosphate cytidylyltransferase [Solirubrobacteraceae bacterium]|nr:2-C-methyl-D-erythritol 4-phosphate cytidylyltransferase [Solirubrobacteraceae bacterium]